MNFLHRALRLQDGIHELPTEDIGFENLDSKEQHSVRVTKFIEDEIKNETPEFQHRIKEEFQGFGPLSVLLADEEITEIVITGCQDIWFEKHGQLIKHNDFFASTITFENIIEKICVEAKTQFNLERPFCDGKFRSFRLHLASNEITQNVHTLSLRRQSTTPWTFSRLCEKGWCDPIGLDAIRNLIEQRKNFLVVGETGSGKTSVLNACLQYLQPNERVVVIEDTSEIQIPNSASTKMITRQDCHKVLPEISLNDLVKQSLRMRPDRLVVGEVRGAEAKDLLLALSTGHSGSLGTLHASSAQQALLRLEMLIQMGAPTWSLLTIRRLLHLSLHAIVVVAKDSKGSRYLKSVNEISGLEESGFLWETLYESFH
jgi:pilus assembly protein CpaF